jgi:lipopolysaccharide transport system ATP-binding protein
VTLHDEHGNELTAIVCGQPLRLRIHYQSEFEGAEHSVNAAFTLRNASGIILTCFANVQAGAPRLALYKRGYLECHWPKVNFRAGTYTSTVFVSVDSATTDWVQDAFQIRIEDGNFYGSGRLLPRTYGDVLVEQSWSSVNTSKY